MRFVEYPPMRVPLTQSAMESLRNVGLLLSGDVMAQLIGLVLLPIVPRTVVPGAIGVMALIWACVLCEVEVRLGMILTVGSWKGPWIP